MPSRLHKLELYRWAVQHPRAEAAFLSRAFAHYNGGDAPTRLREDFAGTSAVAMAWVLLSDDHRALAVERHTPTICWAARRSQRVLGDRAEDLIFVEGDVEAVRPPDIPRVDVVAALNFSTFIYHTRDALLAYFRGSRRSLRAGGVLVIDAYGGPGAMRVSRQDRAIDLTMNEAISDSEPVLGGGRASSHAEAPSRWRYTWDQRSYDAVTGKVDCRIHFDRVQRGHGARRGDVKYDIPNAFRYDWRLWTLPELVEAMREAGFGEVDVWCDGEGVESNGGHGKSALSRKRLRGGRRQGGQRDGLYRPMESMATREDWVAYVVGRR